MSEAFIRSAHVERFTVRVFEAGPDGRALPRALGDYLQEAAANHARILGISIHTLLDQGLAWVLGRMRLSVRSYPQVGREVALFTRHTVLDRRSCGRDFLLAGEDGEVLAECATNWFVMDLATRRMVPPPGMISDIYDPDAVRLIDFATRATPRLEEAEHSVDIHVRESDLDVNDHVNNVRYIDWIAEAMPREVRAGKRLADLDISFRAESVQGDVITSVCGLQDGWWRHSLVRQRDGVEVVRAASLWA